MAEEPPKPPAGVVPKNPAAKMALATGKPRMEPPVVVPTKKNPMPSALPPSKPVEFPKTAMMSKEPAPLLSRRSKGDSGAPPSVKASAPPAMPSALPPTVQPADIFKQDPQRTLQPSMPLLDKPKKSLLAMPDNVKRILIRTAVWLLILSSVSGLGYTTYLMLRETRVEGYVIAPGMQITQVALVRDFRPDAVTLADELALARIPMLADIKETEDFISRTDSDVAGREERLRLLQQELDNVNKETESVIKETSAASQKLWDQVGTDIDKEYQQKRDELGDRLLARAHDINIKFELNQEFKSPEVWVNAFRLALYDAPAKINAVVQRDWAEKQLSDWKDYLKTYDQRMADVKTKIDQVQAAPKDKVTQINVRRADLEDQINQTKTELEPLRAELKDHQKTLTGTQTEEAGLEGNFYPQLIDAAETSKLLTLSVDPKSGVFSWRHIDHMPQYPPGKYWLWVKAQKDDQEYWSVVPIDLRPYQTTQLIIKPGALISTLDVLRAGKAD